MWILKIKIIKNSIFPSINWIPSISPDITKRKSSGVKSLWDDQAQNMLKIDVLSSIPIFNIKGFDDISEIKSIIIVSFA